MFSRTDQTAGSKALRVAIAMAAVMTLSALCGPLRSVAQGLPTGDAEYCARLKEIADHAMNDFNDIAGDQTGDGVWSTPLVLPGQERCYVSKSKSVQFVCESAPATTKAEAARGVELAYARAQACLGKLWDRQTALAEFFLALNDEENQRSVIVSVGTTIEAEPRYFVQTQISRQYQQPMEAEMDQPDVTAAAFCGTLETLVDAGRTQFEPLIKDAKAEPMGDKVHWRSPVVLDGWQECWVHEEGGKRSCRYLSCTLGPFIDDKAAESAMTGIGKDVEACLGWSLAKTRQIAGAIALRVLGGQADPYVEIRPSKSLYSDGTNLKLDIMLDLESCR